MIFAALMIAAAIAATVIIGVYAVGFCGALAFAALLFVIYRAATQRTGLAKPMNSDSLNAFQRPLERE